MRRASIRLRLALWCAVLVTASGATVVIGVLWLTGDVLHARARPSRPPPSGALSPPGPPTAAADQRLADQRRGDVVTQTLDEARGIGLIVVGGLALVSIGIGWVVAGRMLRPVGALAEAAREVSETSLHHRLELPGPRDELRALADSFDAMLDRLDRAFSAQRRFVADASHELRTPLATIRAEVESVLDDPDATAEQARCAARRTVAVLDRGDRLVEALLTLSRSDGIERRERVDLAEVAREVVTAMPGAGGLRLQTELEPAPVRGDPALLERLVANLVENACRYNYPGGLLAVATVADAEAGVLTVVNDGPVLEEDDLPALRQRFHRRARAPGGFGLGLAIADSIIRGHGGKLTLRARPVGGLDVRAVLPTA